MPFFRNPPKPRNQALSSGDGAGVGAGESVGALECKLIYGACLTPGIVQVPSNREGGVSLGQ